MYFRLKHINKSVFLGKIYEYLYVYTFLKFEILE